MKTKMIALFGLMLAVSAPLFAANKNDRIETLSTYDAALDRANAEVKITAGASVLSFNNSNDASLGQPLEYVVCQVKDLAGSKVGERVTFHPDYQPKAIKCARVAWIYKDGTLAVQGDRWPWKTEYVTPKNYVGMVTLICAWGKH